MKKKLTKFLVLFGTILILGASNALAVEFNVYYNPGPYNEAHEDAPIVSMNITTVQYSASWANENNTTDKDYTMSEVTIAGTKLFTATLPNGNVFVGFSAVNTKGETVYEGLMTVDGDIPSPRDEILAKSGNNYVYSSLTTVSYTKNNAITSTSVKSSGYQTVLQWQYNASEMIEGTSITLTYGQPLDFSLTSLNPSANNSIDFNVEGGTPSDYVIKKPSITFKNAGTYVLTGMTTDGATFSACNNPVLTVNIEKATLGLLPSDDIEPQAWSDAGNTFTVMSWDKSLSFDVSDFVVEITPNFSTEESGTLLSWQENQMNGLLESKHNVDGKYYESSYSLSKIESGDYYELQVTGQFPVSGEYTVTVTPAATITNGVVINPETTTVTLYPNIDLSYTDYTVTNDQGETTQINRRDGFNINGYQMANNTINYPMNEAGTSLVGNYGNAVVYTPGNYYDEIKYLLSASELTVDEAGKQLQNLNEKNTIDLTDLYSTSPLYLYVVLEKNGVSSPLVAPILVQRVDYTTGVEVIEENNESEGIFTYYNLHGVKVDNPRNGIFIKVGGNKVEKVIK